MLRPGARATRLGGRRRSRSSSTGWPSPATHVNLAHLHQRADLPRRLARLAARAARQPEGARRRALRPGVDAQPQAHPRLALDPRRLRPTRSSPAATRTSARRIDRGVAIYAVNRLSLLRSGFTVGDESDAGHLQLDPDGGVHAGGGHAVLQRLCPLLSGGPERAGAGRASGAAVVAQRRWPWWIGLGRRARRRRSACASGASSRGCPSPTTPTRTRISSPTRSASSATAGTRTTSSTRRPTRTCCTSSSTSGSAGARACRRRWPPTRPRSSSSRG